jgi:hypothetical protein
VIDLARLPTDALRALSEAGDEVLDGYRSAAAEGLHLCEPLFRARPYRTDVRYPEPKGARDPVSDARYYFHTHPGETTGHFHAFLGCARGYTHLIAISLDTFGLPVELFTVNRWVAADVFLPAGEVCRRLHEFTLANAEPATPNVDRWLSATVRLFLPQIEALLVERDAILDALRRASPGSDPLEDQLLEIPSRVAVDLDEHIAAVRRALSGNS